LQRTYNLFIKDMLYAIEKIRRAMAGLARDELFRDELRVDAILRNLEVIGEAVASVPKEVKEAHPEIPWKDIKNFRNTAIHKYWALDEEILWDILSEELDPLEEALRDLLDPRRD